MLYPYYTKISNNLQSLAADRIGLRGFAIEPADRGKFRLIHSQSGIRLARPFSREETEKLEGWQPPDIPPPRTNAEQIRLGLKLLRAVDEAIGGGEL
jgi:hypothetical protein